MKKFRYAIIFGGIIIAATIQNATLITEPVSMVLLGAGLIGLAGIGRRKLFKQS